MRLVAIGLSHHTAPVELREKLAVPADAVPRVLQRLKDEGVGREAVLISTCNRVELYTVPTEGTDTDQIVAWLAETGGMRPRVASPHLYRFQEQEALRHLFRVASSLDSMVIGEPQILGQVKDAYRLATDANAAGAMMHRVMDRALSVAKRVRTETGIGREAVSVGRAGVELARQVLGELKGRSALLIGAGAHGKLVARSLLSYGLSELVVANRTFQRAVELAEMFGGTATHLDEVDHYLRQVDVVVTSTGAGRVLIDRKMLAPVMQKRRYRSLVMIDLSVPRNIAPDVNAIDGVYRFDVDDLSEVAEQGHDRRREAAQDAERIIDEETARFWRQLMGEAVSARIGGVVRLAEQVRQGELDRAHAVLERLEDADRKAIEAMTRAMLKKVLHRPLSEVRRLAEQGDLDRVDQLLDAFGIADAPPRPVKRPADPGKEDPPDA